MTRMQAEALAFDLTKKHKNVDAYARCQDGGWVVILHDKITGKECQYECISHHNR